MLSSGPLVGPGPLLNLKSECPCADHKPPPMALHSVILPSPLWLRGAGSLWFFALSVVSILFSFIFLYLAFIFGPHFNHSFTDYFFTPYLPGLSIHFFWQIFSPKCSVSLSLTQTVEVIKDDPTTTHADAQTQRGLHFLLYFPSELFPLSLKSFVLLCSWLADNIANLFREKL